MSFLDRLNLRPQERRLVVAIAAAVFVVLNLWFVWPRFRDWGATKEKMAKGQTALDRYKKEIGQVSGVEGSQEKLKKYQSEGLSVLPQEQALQLIRIVQTKAALTGVQQNGITPVPKLSAAKTNEFFEEQSLTMNFINTGEKELVEFLYTLGANDSLLRVRDMTLRPEQGGYKLAGSVTLTASFQKKAPGIAASTSATTPATRPSVVPPKTAPSTTNRPPSNPRKT